MVAKLTAKIRRNLVNFMSEFFNLLCKDVLGCIMLHISCINKTNQTKARVLNGHRRDSSG